jgi:hypothetical protein
MEPAAFTAHVARIYGQAAPEARVTVKGPLELDIDTPRGHRTTLLSSLYHTCLNAPEACDTAIAGFVAHLSPFVGGGQPPLTREGLRIVVRANDAIDEFRRRFGREPAAAPLVGDLWMMVVSDLADVIITHSAQSLAPLDLSFDEVLAIGRANMREALAETLDRGAVNFDDGVFLLAGDDYCSSLMLFPELWRPLSESMGRLLVAAPASDAVLMCSGHAPGAAERLAETAQMIMDQASRPISASVFRWRPEGWIMEWPGSAATMVH